MALHQVLLGLGSNIGDRRSTLEKAYALIEERCGVIFAKAPIYETEPIGAADQIFLNTACLCQTDLSPHKFLSISLEIEKQLGRQREIHWGNRTIDIDLLLWVDQDGNSLQEDTPNLVLPHPFLLVRDFALVPASNIAGEWIHPKSGFTLNQERIRRGYQLTSVLD